MSDLFYLSPAMWIYIQNGIIYAVIFVFAILAIFLSIHYWSTIKLQYLDFKNALFSFKKYLKGFTSSNIETSYIDHAFETKVLPEILQNSWLEYRVEIDNTSKFSFENAYKYFSPSNLLDSKLKNKEFLKAFPGILTSWGLLGTFLAILLSLWCVNVDPDTSKVSGIEQLISGLSAKFISSIVALFCAIIYVYKERHLYSELKKSCYELCQTLEQLFPIISEKKMLYLLNQKIDNQQKIMNKFGENIEHISSETCSKMANEFINQLNSTSTEYFKNINDVFCSLCASLKEAQENQQEINNISENSIKNQKEILNKIENSIVKTNEKVEIFNKTIVDTNNLIDRISHITGEMSYTSEQYAELLPDLKEIKNAVIDLNMNLNSNITEFLSVSNQFTQEKFKPILENLESTIKTTLQEIQSGMSESADILNGSIDWYQERMNEFKDSTANNITEIGTAMDNYASKTNNFLAQYDESMAKAVGALNTNIDSLDNSMFDNVKKLDKNITDLNNKLTALSTVIQNTIPKFQDTVPKEENVNE